MIIGKSQLSDCFPIWSKYFVFPYSSGAKLDPSPLSRPDSQTHSILANKTLYESNKPSLHTTIITTVTITTHN